MAAVIVATACASMALAVGVLGAERVALAAGCSSPVGAGEVRVVIVVDPGSAGSPSSTCMVVPDGTTGSQLLARRAAELGAMAPRYASSGLLCAIDGYPSSGCGDRTAGGFAYWAYFAGASGTWSYGNNNPFIKRLHDGDVEGWRFVDGAGDGQDPPPRLGPAGLFPAVVAPSAPSSPGTNDGGAVVAPGAGSVGSVAGSTGGVAIDGVDATTTTTVGTDTDATQLASSIGGGSGSSGSKGSSSGLIAIVAVLAIIAALGAGAWARTRRGS